MGVRRASNFASHPARPVGAVTVGCWALGLGLAAGLIWSWYEVAALRAEAARLEIHAERLEDETATLAALAERAPAAEAISAQAAEVQRFNLLTGPRRLPLAEVLGLLETALPVTVRVSQLSYDAETGRLAFSLQARDEAELPPALRGLEALPALGSVILERQVRVSQGNETLVQYDVEAVTR